MDDNVKIVSDWLKNYKQKYDIRYVIMYHAARKDAPIEKEGILAGNIKRRNFYASERGYVYLATTPKMAEMFGSMAHNDKFTVYEVIVQVDKLLSDKIRLQHTAFEGSKGNKLAQSLVHGGSARVKGSIERWQIKPYEREEVINIDQVQSHTNDRSVALSIKATKITARLLAQAMQAFLRHAQNPKEKRGKQSIKSLTKSGASIDNVEIPSDCNINSFKKTARKYNIDFALKKDSSTDPPNWIVFFKSKDSKSMDAAFKEFSQSVLNSKKASVPSMAQEMERLRDIAKGLTPSTPGKAKDKGEIDI